jgi:hypothetical protein
MTQPYQPQPYVPPNYGQQPQAYAAPPQQPQYGAPQGTPWLPPQYGGQPAGPVGGQALPTTPPPLGQSARTGGDGPKAPAPRHLVGRTVIFEPIRIDETTTQKNDKTGEIEVRPTAYYHLTVVDGGPLQFGDNQSRNPKEAHGLTLEVQTPARFTNVSSDRFGIVNEVRDAMARGDAASVGVVQQGTRGNYPFLVTKTSRDLDGNDRPDGAQRFEAATLVWNQIFAKTFTSPEPRSLVAAPTSTPPQVQYQPTAPAGYAQQQYAQTGTVPTPYGAAPAGQLHPEYVAAATQPTYGQQGQYGYPAAPNEAMTAYQPSAIAPQVQQMPRPAPATVQPNPAFEAWLATLPPEQQAAQRAAMAGAAPQPAATGGPGF